MLYVYVFFIICLQVTKVSVSGLYFGHFALFIRKKEKCLCGLSNFRFLLDFFCHSLCILRYDRNHAGLVVVVFFFLHAINKNYSLIFDAFLLRFLKTI